MHNWSKFWHLSRQERRQLSLSLISLPVAILAVRLVGFRRWHSALAQITPLKTSPGSGAKSLTPEVRAAARMVKVAAHYTPYATCVHQSLVLWWLLRRQGVESELRIGVRKDHGRQLGGHAWVELLGQALNDDENVHQRFNPLNHPAPPVGAKQL